MKNLKGLVGNSYFTVYFSGILFAIGLGVSGMTLPQKVLAFLDITGDWDPSLLLVIGGSALTYFVVHRFVLKRSNPLFENTFTLPARKDIDSSLVMGAVLFGIGWGLVGLCPGSVVTLIATGDVSVLIFFISMITGMYVFNTLRVIGDR